MDELQAELERLRGDCEATCKGPNLKPYSSFYSLVQALMYVFCFRWLELEHSKCSSILMDL